MNSQKILKEIRMLEKVFMVEPEEPEWKRNSREIIALLKEYERLTLGMSAEEDHRIAKEIAREICRTRIF
jgi:hypothetical protein